MKWRVYWAKEKDLWKPNDCVNKRMREEPFIKSSLFQGLDYAYTLDGWLKAINSEVLSNDPSRDGISGIYQHFARDVFSLLLRYYPNDYNPIQPTATSLEAFIDTGFQHLYKPYYTGWISSWSLHLDTLHTAYSFRYDRLGRLTRATTLDSFDGISWKAMLARRFSAKYSYDLVGNILSLTRFGSDTNEIDVLDYNYYDLARNNRLEYIDDKVERVIGIDLDDQDPGNYRYDAVGNMIYDEKRDLHVFYTYSNKPKRVKIGNRTIKMRYNPSGYRFYKGSGNNNGDIFIYNSQGQLMAKYSINGNTLKLDFIPIYEGTKRLGILEVSNISWQHCPQTWLPPCNPYRTGSGIPEGRVLRANRKYELTDHLNNVRVVIMDQRVPVSDSNNQNVVAYYKPLVKSIHDYYPFGWEKQLTTVNPYPFNYQGQLFDRELGWQYYRYRNYDPRVARFWQVEPLVDSFPMWSGYGYMNGMVTYGIEQEGLWVLMIGGFGDLGRRGIGVGGSGGILIEGDWRGVTGVYVYATGKGGLSTSGSSGGISITWFPSWWVKKEHVEGWGGEYNIGVALSGKYFAVGVVSGPSFFDTDDGGGISISFGAGQGGLDVNLYAAYTFVFDITDPDVAKAILLSLQASRSQIEEMRRYIEDRMFEDITVTVLVLYFNVLEHLRNMESVLSDAEKWVQERITELEKSENAKKNNAADSGDSDTESGGDGNNGSDDE